LSWASHKVGTSQTSEIFVYFYISMSSTGHSFCVAALLF
jgi:hypothetical protein